MSPTYSPQNPYTPQDSGQGPGGGYSPQNPYASQQQQGTYSPQNPYAVGAQPEEPGHLDKAIEIMKQMFTHPRETYKAMTKAGLEDAIRTTVTPTKVTDKITVPGMATSFPPVGLPMLAAREVARRAFGSDSTLDQPQTPGQLGGAALRTGVNTYGIPGLGHVLGGAVIGAVNSPDDPATGAIVGATLGTAGAAVSKAVGAVGTRMGLNRAEGTTALPAGAKTTVPQGPDVVPSEATPGPKPIRDLSNAEVLNMTPEGVKISAKQAAVEEKNLYTELFGPKPGRRYRAARARLDSGASSPEQAAKDQALLTRLRADLSPEQLTELDQVHSKGFTAARLNNIHSKIKDYTPENLAAFDDESLIRQFGEVLMTKNPNRNLSGMYRFRALLGEARNRGLTDAQMLRGTYDYMKGEGIPTDGLAEKIMGQILETRKTLSNVMPEAVAPPAEPGAAPAAPAEVAPAPAAPTPTPVRLGPEGIAQSLADKLVQNPDQLAKIYAENRAVSDAAKAQGKNSAYADAFIAYVDQTYPGISKLSEQSPAPQVVPEIPGPEALPAPTKENLGTPTEEQLQQELQDLVPQPRPPGEADAAARARVEAARTTPFPGRAPGEPLLTPAEPPPVQPPPGAREAAPPAPVIPERITPPPAEQLPPPEVVGSIVPGAEPVIPEPQRRAIHEAVYEAMWDKMTPAERQQGFGVDEVMARKGYAELSETQQKSLKDHMAAVRLRQEPPTPPPETPPPTKLPRGPKGPRKGPRGNQPGFIDFGFLGDAMDRIFRPKEAQGALPKYSQELEDNLVRGPKEEPKKGLKYRPVEGWYSAIFRKTRPIELTEAKIREAGGKFSSRQSVADQIQRLSGWAGLVHRYMDIGSYRNNGDAPPTPTGPSLRAIYSSVGSSGMNALDRYLLAKHVDELNSQGRSLVSNISPEAARLEVENAPDAIKSAGQNISSMAGDVLHNAQEGGLISGPLAEVFRNIYKHYAPMQRVLDGEGPPIPRSTRLAGSVADPFRKLKESGLKFAEPTSAVVDYIRRVTRATEVNKVMNNIARMAEANPEIAGDWIVQRGTTADVGGATEMSARDLVSLFKEAGLPIDESSAREAAALLSKKSLLMDGDWVRYRDARTGKVEQVKLNPEMAAIIRSMSPEDASTLQQFLAMGAQGVRTGVAVLDPVFAARQALADVFHAKMNSKYGFKMGRSTLDAVVSMIKKDKNWADFYSAGGAYSTFLPSGRGTEAAYQSIYPRTDRPGTVAGTVESGVRKAGRILAHPEGPKAGVGELVNTAASLMDPLVELVKLGEFISARRKGADVFESAIAGREVAGDLAMAGTKVSALKNMTAFLGPYLAGTEKTFRSIRERPGTMLVRGIQAITVPSALLWWAASKDQEVRDLQKSTMGEKWWFLRVPVGARRVLPSGEFVNGKDNIVRIRKPQIWGEMFGGTIEDVLDEMETKDPEKYKRTMQAFADELKPPGLPNVLETFNGLRTGVDPRTGQSIVPASREKLDPELQYGYQTSEFAKRVGMISGQSPAMIDFALRSLGGTAASAALAGADKLIGHGGYSPPEPVKADIPMLGELFGRAPSTIAEPLQTFYKNADKVGQTLNSANDYKDKLRPEQYMQYIEDHIEDIVISSMYAQYKEGLSKIRDQIDFVRNLPDDAMDPKQKRELMDTYMEQMIEEARNANNANLEYRRSNKEAAAAVGGVK